MSLDPQTGRRPLVYETPLAIRAWSRELRCGQKTLALVPTTGLPLPFISYGRSNLLIALLATGIMINIGNHGGKAKRR